MRLPRSIQLQPSSATVHLYWRCHNKEFYLNAPQIKELYFQALSDALEYKKQGESVRIHSFCAMNNHFHQSVAYSNGSANLSKFMRYSHSLFGARYNRGQKRSGKVAEGRPKTPRIQNVTHEMRVHFYIEANPIRAKFRTIENLKDYCYSSYGFYAYGKQSPITRLLTIPKWYLDLGSTQRERQKKYRRLFIDYLKESHLEFNSLFFKPYIGDALWFLECKEQMTLALKQWRHRLNDEKTLNLDST